ncbi:MAG TPA: MaoC family dehydratase N-terminal domain-containing protein [Myxococcota bacterium]|nr:MaoC family dehydratase N-terminal domain-containing protein [Myxococcota bacterium]
MFKQKSLIGTEIDTITQTIERGAIKNLHRALGKNPHHPSNSELFPAFLLGQLVNMPQIHKVLSLGTNQVLLSRESITAHRAIKVGDTIKVQTFLKDVYEQQATSNPIGFIILDSIGSLDANVVFYCEKILAVRGGFSRGH